MWIELKNVVCIFIFYNSERARRIFMTFFFEVHMNKIQFCQEPGNSVEKRF